MCSLWFCCWYLNQPCILHQNLPSFACSSAFFSSSESALSPPHSFREKQVEPSRGARQFCWMISWGMDFRRGGSDFRMDFRRGVDIPILWCYILYSYSIQLQLAPFPRCWCLCVCINIYTHTYIQYIYNMFLRWFHLFPIHIHFKDIFLRWS